MSLRDFLILVGICLVWAGNNVMSKVVVDTWAVPPLLYAGIRFAIVALVTARWLLPMPRPAWRLVLVAMLMGGASFGLNFMALQTVTPSAAGVVSQAGVPMTTLLSILLLKERIRWRRALGITITLTGVLVVVWTPGIAITRGMLLVLASSFAASLGAVLIKQMDAVAPLRLQAWVGLTGASLLLPLSAGTEEANWHNAITAGWPFVAALLFSALIVSVVAHTAYYVLIRRYDANLVAPLTLITPLATIALGALITNDHLSTRMLIGTAIALTGVLIVALRRTKAPIPEAQEHS